MLNQIGEGSVKTIVMPPNKKKAPMMKANFVLCEAADIAVVSAPAKVPIAWAKKGNRKCFGSNKCIVACIPSVVVTSAPFGGGMIEPLSKMILILTILPITRPAITAKVFLKMGFIIFVF
jgi:hypothetical protein